MPLKGKDIQPGAVAYLSVDRLSNDNRITKPASPTLRDGPFVCFQTADGMSAWAPLTTVERSERLEIIGAWRLEGSATWQSEDMYLNDGATTYVGPFAAFIDASREEMPFRGHKRPRVAAKGVAAILKTVSDRNGAQLGAPVKATDAPG